MKSLFYVFISFLIYSCNSDQISNIPIRLGNYKAVMVLNDTVNLSFQIKFENKNKTLISYLTNGKEEIKSDTLYWKDSILTIENAVFNTKFEFAWNNNRWEGYYYNLDKEDYKIYTFLEKWETKKSIDTSFNGNWKTTFLSDSSTAIGIFKSTDGQFNGTFLTETGDYRFLDGWCTDSTLELSTFDGSHAYLFKAKLISTDSILGQFYSGNHFFDNWVAVKDEFYQLRDADQITFMKNPQEILEFTCLSFYGDTLSFKHDLHQGKATVIQILGSWCPNCMDETNYFVSLQEKYSNDIQFIGIAFERSSDYKLAKPRVEKMKDNLKVNYPIFFGGKARKKNTSEVFSQLNSVSSYPTTIVVNKLGKVVYVHTGFSGKGTGKVYEAYTKHFENDVLNQFLSP